MRARTNRLIGGPLAVAAAAALAVGAPATAAQAATSCNVGLAGTTIRTAPGYGKTVALTFDDSSAADMTSVLAILRKNNVRATFFDIGSEDAKMPNVLRAAVRDGHLVEPHSWHHDYPSAANGNWSIPYLTREVVATAAQQRAVTGRQPCFFRPPGGHMVNVPAVMRAQGMQAVLWSVDSRDWTEQRTLTAAATAGIVQRATDLRYADRNHPIVLLHDGKMSPEPGGHTFLDRPNTSAALPKIIEWYRARGYRFVAMDGTSGLNPVPVAYNPAPSGVGFTSDARPDMLAVTRTGDLNLYAGNGAGYVTGPTKIGAGWSIFNGVYATDWSGDKNRDVLARTSTGDLRMYRGTGYGTVDGTWVKIGSGWNMYDTVLAPGDVTGDGKADLLGRTPSGLLNLYRGNGAGGFDGPGVNVGTGWATYDRLVPGDFNGDGTSDLFGRTRDGNLWFLPGTGNGHFGARVKVGPGWNMFSQIFSAGDLDGDGRADVSAITPGGTMFFYAGVGDGTLQDWSSHQPTGWTFPVVIGVN